MNRLLFAWGHRRWLARAAARRLSDGVSELMFRSTHPLMLRPGQNLALTVDAVVGAIDRGIQFIRNSQHPDGSFRAFLLLPGASVSWITAHLALLFENIPGTAPLCLTAAKYLEATGALNGGWGFNDLVRNDIDSTAQALMVLQRHSLALPPAAVEAVLAAQSPSGGFATFLPSGKDRLPASGWETPHPDVTLIVVELLRRLGVHEAARRRAIEWLATQAGGGRVLAYWWSSRAYSLWAENFSGTATEDTRTQAQQMLFACRTAPYLPMLLSVVATQNCQDLAWRAPVATLLAAQARDGSWPCTPCLRVTDRGEYLARKDARGRVHRDSRRLFSTAHSVAALSLFSRLHESELIARMKCRWQCGQS